MEVERQRCSPPSLNAFCSLSHRAFTVLAMRPPPLSAAAHAAADAAHLQPLPPQRSVFTCGAAQLRGMEGELRRSYRLLSVAIHPDKCSHALASKVPISPCSQTQKTRQ